MDQDLLDRAMAATTAEGTLAHRMGITIVSASGTEVVATMPVAGNIQPFGLLHGGASCVLAETIGSLGAALHAGGGRVVVGIEISATHHRGATDGRSEEHTSELQSHVNLVCRLLLEKKKKKKKNRQMEEEE